MKRKASMLLMTLALLVALIGAASPVQAAAYGTSFTTSITYFNVGTGPANITLNFYNEADGTAIPISVAQLPANAGASLYVGNLTQVSSGFRGSALLSSDQPLVATLVQLAPSSSSVKVRPLSNGFGSGSASALVPTVLKNTFGSTSIVSVQNVDTVGADLSIAFIPVSGSTVTETLTNLPPNTAKYFDLGTLSDLGQSFNGSMKITAVQTGTSNPGSIVATSLELSTNSIAAYAFEGASQFGTTIYMPSALCQFSGQNSYYAVQNTDTSNVSVVVKYSNGNSEPSQTIAPGAKFSFPGCGVSGSLNPAGFLGSATITATGGTITAVGKVSGGGLSTAFLGFPSGSFKVALPYVRWTTSNWLSGQRQRAYIAIQNIGASNLAAGAVTVKYYDNNGNLVGTDSLGAIAVGSKANSNPSNLGAAGAEFGYYGTAIGGGAVVEGPSGSQLAVVVRITSYSAGATLGEDYTGTSVGVN